MTTNFQIQTISFLTIQAREIKRFLRIWPQTLLPPLITNTLYLLIFGKILATQITLNTNLPYIAYIIPGLIIMSIINNAYTNVASSFFSAKFQNSIEEILVSPTTHLTMTLGYLSGGIARGLLSGLGVYIVSLFFYNTTIHSLFIILIVAFITTLLFSLAGLLNGLLAKNFDDISIIPTFILTPLIYLGGIFYEIHALPTIWQKISLYNPIVYIISLFRYGFTGDTEIPIIYSLMILSITTILLIIGIYLLISKKNILQK